MVLAAFSLRNCAYSVQPTRVRYGLQRNEGLDYQPCESATHEERQDNALSLDVRSLGSRARVNAGIDGKCGEHLAHWQELFRCSDQSIAQGRWHVSDTFKRLALGVIKSYCYLAADLPLGAQATTRMPAASTSPPSQNAVGSASCRKRPANRPPTTGCAKK